MSDETENFIRRQDVAIKVGDVEHKLRVKVDLSDIDELVAAHGADVLTHMAQMVCDEIKKEVTPELIVGLFTKTTAATEPPPKFDVELLPEILMPFAIVTSPTFLVEADGESTPFACRSQNFNSIADFNRMYANDCVAIHSARKVDEEAEYRAQGINSLEAMRQQLGRGPRTYCRIEYAVLTEEQLEHIEEDYLPTSEELD